MANTLISKRSAVPAKVPTTAQLELGEIAVNTYDGKVYIKKDDGTESIVEVGGVDSVDGRTGVVTLGDLYATAAQGALADSALQSGDNVSELTNDAGYITSAPVDSVDGRTGVVTLGDLYATAAQGALADTSVQPGDNITDLNNNAGYITSAPVDSVDGRTGVVTLGDLYATTAQGALADSALQSGDNVSLLVNNANYTSTGDNISVFVNDAGYVTTSGITTLVGIGGVTEAISTNVSIDASTTNVYQGTGGTFAFTSIPTGMYTCTLYITGSSSTFPAGTKWMDATAPTLTTDTDIVILSTPDGGTTWYGSYSVGYA